MTDAIQTHCETALESPYSRDRTEAIEELERLFPDASAEQKRQILETLREIAHEATGTQERQLARETMVETFDADPAVAESVVVPSFCDLAADASHSEERLDAIDSLRVVYPTVNEELRNRIQDQLTTIAESATYEDERRKARRRLSDIANSEVQSNGESATDGERAVGYLGQSLAEQLTDAADDSPEACRRRADELSEFLENNPVDADEYESIRNDVTDLAEQLAVIPTNGRLDDDRKQRVERVAERTKRLYIRGE